MDSMIQLLRGARPMIALPVLLFFASIAAAQSTPQVDDDVILEISLASKTQKAFRIGETIPLNVSFRTQIRNHYELNMAQYDRSGRMSYERFVISPAEGAVDPLPAYTSSMGGITNHQYLKSEAWVIGLNLNEWIRFERPGEYRLRVFSNRVGIHSPDSLFGAPVTARSNEIRIDIIAATPEWQKQMLDDAVKTLEAPRLSRPGMILDDNGSRRKAAETLRFLGTAGAVKEMVKRLRADDPDGLQFVYQLGIISSSQREAASNAVDDALADPDRPIDGSFLYIMRALDDASPKDWKLARRVALERLLGVLPNKRGKALTISLGSAVSEAWDGQDLPKELMDRLVNQLFAAFDQLPLNEQNILLDSRWEKIKSPALVPLLKRRAELFQDFPEMRESKAYDSLQLSASALLRWYEMDPDGARPAIINEIMRPRPRYNARVLGVLPDETLPEVDAALAEHFLASEDLDAGDNLASLIERYASEAILPQIVEKLDGHNGRWACAIQEPILAYVLRVNPAIARPRIEKAVAARGKEYSACNRALFSAVAPLHYDPILEELAIRSLNDPDPEVAISAAAMLGRHGSPAAESALWERYGSWCARWAGHESQLKASTIDGLGEGFYQRALGETLMRALATGQSWLSDKAYLQRLSRLTTVPTIREELERDLKAWDGPAFSIDVQITSRYFSGRVAQYELQSMDNLKNKLGQFPSGSKFVFGNGPGASPAVDRSIAEVRDFLKSQGMVVDELK